MELEQQRGISITRSLWSSSSRGTTMLLDTPGHEDFSEDTYRTLLAVDSGDGDRCGQGRGASDAQAVRCVSRARPI